MIYTHIFYIYISTLYASTHLNIIDYRYTCGLHGHQSWRHEERWDSSQTKLHTHTHTHPIEVKRLCALATPIACGLNNIFATSARVNFIDWLCQTLDVGPRGIIHVRRRHVPIPTYETHIGESNVLWTALRMWRTSRIRNPQQDVNSHWSRLCTRISDPNRNV